MNPAPPAWVNGDFVKPPAFAGAAASANAPPNIPFPTYFNVNATQDVVDQPDQGRGPAHDEDRLLQHAQLQGRAGDRHRLVRHHQLPAGHRRTNASTRRSGSPTRRSARSARISQASNYVEGNFVYDNREAYVQDNWKVNNRLTLDYGMRFVHPLPQYDKLGQGSNFLPDKWSRSAAPQLYRPGCAVTGAGGHRVSGREPARR